MKGVCEYPGCNTPLSELMPEEIRHCGEHQYVLREKRRELTVLQLPEEDIQFALTHPEGCGASQLFLHLDILPSTMIRHLQRGTIKGRKDRKSGCWRIPYREMIRAIDLVRNWIGAKQAAEIIQADSGTFLAYARGGHFGPCRRNLSGRWAVNVRRRETSSLKTRYEEIRNRRLAHRRPREYLGKGEVTPGTIKRRLGITFSAIYYWIEQGHLPFRRGGNRGQRYVIRKCDFMEFAQKVVAGEYRVRPHLEKAFREVVAQAQHSN